MNVFEKKEYKEAFEQFREIPESIFIKYFDLINQSSKENAIILDVGAGPGIQTEHMLNLIPKKWKVVALEPSIALSEASKKRLVAYKKNIIYLNDTILNTSFEKKIDFVWMSEVTHLLGEPNIWVEHLMNFLNEDGCIVIRSSTHQQIRERQWYDFFPSARVIDIERHPNERKIKSALINNGFEDYQEKTIDESRVIPKSFFIDMISNKCFSTLHKVSNTEFEKGLELIKDYYKNTEEVLWHYEMTSFSAKFNDYGRK